MTIRVCNDCGQEKGVLAMYQLAQKITSLTGVKMQVDHIVPGQSLTSNLTVECTQHE